MKAWRSIVDLELMLVVLSWAFNITVVKVSLASMEPLAFNILRFTSAAILLLGFTRLLEGSLAIDRRDLPRFVLLGLLGHTLYQVCFVTGIARTTASSTALIFGSSPVVIALASRIAGHERLRLSGLAGAALAFAGVWFLVTGKQAGDPATGSVLGDLLILSSVVLWAVYTVMSRPLLDRYSPLKVSALTLSIGALMLVPLSVADLRAQDWNRVEPLAWAGIVYSFLFALCLSYVLWYRSVLRVGNLKTAIYSNLVPVFGTVFGVWLLGEPWTRGLWLGGLCILAGIVVTRLPDLRPGAGRGPSPEPALVAPE